MPKDSDNKILVEGEVVNLNRDLFTVQLKDSGATVLCTLSGKMRLNSIRVLLSDEVIIELDAYDMSKGRIMQRIKK